MSRRASSRRQGCCGSRRACTPTWRTSPRSGATRGRRGGHREGARGRPGAGAAPGRRAAHRATRQPRHLQGDHEAAELLTRPGARAGRRGGGNPEHGVHPQLAIGGSTAGRSPRRGGCDAAECGSRRLSVRRSPIGVALAPWPTSGSSRSSEGTSPRPVDSIVRASRSSRAPRRSGRRLRVQGPGRGRGGRRRRRPRRRSSDTPTPWRRRGARSGRCRPPRAIGSRRTPRR